MKNKKKLSTAEKKQLADEKKMQKILDEYAETPEFKAATKKMFRDLLLYNSFTVHIKTDSKK